MPDLTVSADIDAFLAAANDAAARTELGLTTLATTTPGTGVVAALGTNTGSAGAFVLFNGAGGTPSSINLANGVSLPITGVSGLGTGVATFLATPSSANLASAVTGETGSGALMFGTSPEITTSITTGSTTLAVFNATATTVNAFGAATTLNIGASAATVLNFGGFTSAAELRFLEPSGSGTNYSGFKQAALGTSITYTLPTDAPANGDVLTCQTDGTLSWEPQSGAANAVTAASAAGSSGLFWVSGGADRTATATNTITTINATNANVTNLLPVSNDGAAIGASGTAFSDLFLASGAVINFNAGNYTLTHSAGVLTANGAIVATTGTFGSASSVLVGTAGSAVGSVGFRNATSGTITVAPTTGALGTVTLTLPAVTATVCAAATSTTTTQALFATSTAGAPAFRALAAGDLPSTLTSGTAITNAVLTTPNIGTPSAGVGTNITGLVPANIVAGTLGGTITLGEGTQQIALDPALSADGTYSGIIVTGTSGYAQTIGDLVYLDPTDSRWEAADANSASGADGDARGNLAMVVVAGTDGNSCTLLLRGRARFASFPAGMTINNPLYVSETAGAITQTQPTTTDAVIRIIGHATTADEINFCPDNMWITHT